MSLKKWQNIILLAFAFAAVFAFIAIPSLGPRYQGRSLKSWFYNPGTDDSEAFRSMGREVVPFLVERLEDAPSAGVSGLLGAFSTTPEGMYRQRKRMWQQRAIYLLGEMGNTAYLAEKELTQAATSDNWAVKGTAVVALMKIQQQPVAPLIEKLRDTRDSQAWYENAMMVGQFGPKAEPAIPYLLGALQRGDGVVQAHALIALGMIAKQPEKCVPAIVPFMASRNVGHRQKAIGALLAFGTNALPARTAIEGALVDPDRWVRNQAGMFIKILGKMVDSGGAAGRTNPTAVATRAQLLRSPTNQMPEAAGSGR